MSDIISFVNLVQVRVESQKSTLTIYREIRHGTFPAPIKIGLRAVVWTRDYIKAWKRSCIEAAKKM